MTFRIYIAEHVSYDYYQFNKIVGAGVIREKVVEGALKAHPLLPIIDDENEHKASRNIEREHIYITQW